MLRPWNCRKPFVGNGLLLLALLSLAGCEQALVPVSGKVRLQSGQPLAQGDVAFYADGRPQSGREIPRAKIAEDGSYTLATDGQPGAPPGRYRVVVIAQEVVTERPTPGSGVWATRKLIDAKYFDARQTPLCVEVAPGPSSGAFDLVVQKTEPRK